MYYSLSEGLMCPIKYRVEYNFTVALIHSHSGVTVSGWKIWAQLLLSFVRDTGRYSVYPEH
jgi:hypothetical protein